MEDSPPSGAEDPTNMQQRQHKAARRTSDAQNDQSRSERCKTGGCEAETIRAQLSLYVRLTGYGDISRCPQYTDAMCTRQAMTRTFRMFLRARHIQAFLSPRRWPALSQRKPRRTVSGRPGASPRSGDATMRGRLLLLSGAARCAAWPALGGPLIGSARADRLSAAVGLFQALGGGWSG